MRALLLSTGPRALCLSPTIRRAASSSLPESTADDAAATWTALCAEASAQLESPSFARFGMDRFLHTEVLAHESLEAGLAHVLGAKFNANDSGDSGVEYEALLMHALNADPSIGAAASADLHRFLVVDPAAAGLLGPYLFYKGFQAVQCARVANYFWREPGGDGQMVARLLQSEMADVFGVDIHPGATFGRGVTIDHATGVVIGETAVVGDRVYIMHDVTLGATGTSPEHDRHPKVGNDVLLGANSSILGNVVIGDGARVAAAAVVNKDVPPGATAVGVPAKMLTINKTGSS